MNIQKNGRTWTIELASECTIVDVEGDFDRLRDLPDYLRKINLKAGGLQEIDTAYFQLLLALKSSTRQRGIKLQLHDAPEVLQRIEMLYGTGLSGEALEQNRNGNEVQN